MTMTVGRFHAAMMTLAPALACVAVMSGSDLLLTSASILIAAMVLTAGRLRSTDRPRAFVAAIHGLTAVILMAALASARTTAIDSVLVIILLGIFNRFVLRGGHRDDFLIAGATSVLLAAATTITPGILFLFIVLAFIPALLFGLWAAQMLGAAERDDLDPAAKRAAIELIARRPLPSGLGRITALSLTFTLIGFGLVSFLPRHTFSQTLAAGYFMGLPGASSSMELRTSGATSASDSTPVLYVEPSSGRADLVRHGLYARLYVLDHFDGRTFSASSNGGLFSIRTPADAEQEERDALGEGELEPNTVQVTLNRLVRDTPAHPLAILGRSAPAEIVRKRMLRTLSGTLVSGHFRGASLSYEARLDRPGPPAELPRHLVDVEAATLLELPESVDPRVAELGRTLAAERATARDKMDAVIAHLGRGFRYSLDALPGQSSDPLVRFLFEAKEGHCELFAAALAVLLRAGGVKARVATGYYGGKWNGLGGYLVYTQEDAHAWVEAYDEEEARWVWLDATPEDLRVRRRDSVFGTLRDWYDAVEGYWFEHVIDFDESRRKQLVARFSRALGALGEGWWDREGEGQVSPERARLGGVASAVGLAALIGGIILFLRARRARSFDLTRMGLRLRRALGARPDENATLGTLLERVEAERRGLAARCVAAYEAMRFGPPDATPDRERFLLDLAALESLKTRSS